MKMNHNSHFGAGFFTGMAYFMLINAAYEWSTGYYEISFGLLILAAATSFFAWWEYHK